MRRFSFSSITLAGSQRTRIIVLGLLLTAVIAGWLYTSAWYKTYLLDAKRTDIQRRLAPYGNTLATETNWRFAQLEGLGAFARTNPTRFALDRHFEEFAAALYTNDPIIRAIQIFFREGAVYTYPIDTNEIVLERTLEDLINDERPEVRADVQRTIETREIATSGPYELRQGGTGFLARLAIYENDELLGIAVIVVNAPLLLDQAGLMPPPSGTEVALHDENGWVTGSASVLDADPESYAIDMPDNTWTLAMIPAGGWERAIRGPLWIFRVILIGIAGLVFGGLHLSITRQGELARAVQERTAALSESHERYRTLVEQSPFAIVVHQNERLTFVNPATVRLMGVNSADELIGKSIDDIIHPESLKSVYERKQQLVAGNTHLYPIEDRYILPDGREVPVEVTVAPFTYNGNPAVQVIALDISARKSAEASLRESEKSFRLLFESNPHPMWVYDLETLAFMEANDALIDHYGYSREELATMTLTDIFAEQEHARVIEVVQQRKHLVLHRSGEWKHRLKDGQIIDVELISHTLKFTGHKAVLVVAQDITARKQTQQAEREQRQFAEALAGAATALSGTLDLDQVLDRVLANIGRVVPHDGAYVMLIDAEIVYVARCWGFAEFGVEDEMTTLRTPLAELYDLQWMATHYQPYVVPDTYNDTHWTHKPPTDWAHSYVGAPLFREERVIGFLGLLSQQPTFFTTTHAERLQAFANQAAVGILNAQLFEEERNQRTLAQALRDSASALISAFELKAVMNAILENVARVVPHTAANIMLIEGEHAHPVYWRGYDTQQNPAIEQFRLPIANTPNLRVMLETKNTFLVPHTDAYEDWVSVPLTAWVKSYIAAPICSHNNVIGILNLDSDIPGFFNEVHAQQLQAFADQASIAIEQAQLYEEIRRHAASLEQRVADRTAQLNRTLKRLEAILYSSNDIIIICDPDGTIKQINPALLRTFHCAESEALSQPLEKLIVPDHVDEFRQAFERLLRDAQPQRVELTIRCPGKSSLDADVVLSPIIEEDQQISGIVCSIRDMTQRKQLEDQLRQMLEHEMELGELKSRYVSMAAHDLRNPLAVIQSSLNMIHQYGDRLSEERRLQKFDNIQTNINVMVTMLDDILTLGRVESDKLRFQPAPLDVINFCENLVSEMKQATATRQPINFSAEGTCDIALLDAQLLRHILGNLLSNAIKYSAQDCPITFSVTCQPDQITFVIQDQGIGIPEADQAKLFETFHRASNTQNIPGTGLGLAIVKQSVELHGGAILFESTEDAGTTFTVTIPQVTLERLYDEENTDR